MFTFTIDILDFTIDNEYLELYTINEGDHGAAAAGYEHKLPGWFVKLYGRCWL